MTFERRLFYYLENLKRQLRTQPLILGGISASGGGIGMPPGGFIGQLPQTRVTFDYTEETTISGIPASGMSLLDNLNRIRYDIANLSGGGSASNFLDLTDSPSSYTGHGGKAVVVNVGEDGVEFSLVSSGTQIVYDYKQEDITSQIPASGDDFDLTQTPVSGMLTVHYNGVTQQPNNYTILASGIHTKFSPISGDELFVEYRYTVSGGTSFIDVQKDDATVVSGVLTLNFEGAVIVTDEGGKKVTVTVSGVTGSGGASTFLELTDVDPSTYTGEAGKSVVVNTGEDGLEFVLVSGGGSDVDAIHVDVANEITGITAKTTPVAADEFVIEDSAAAYIKKAVTFGNLEDTLSITESQVSDLDHTDIDAIHDNVSAEISGIATKTTPVDADIFVIEDSAASWAKKKLTVANLASVISGGSGGSSIVVKDEGVPVVSGVTSLDFIGNQIEATTSGTNVSITVSGYMVDPPAFIGCRTYLDTDFQVTTSDGWQYIDYDAENYDTDSMWSSGGNQDVNTAGYYHVSGQVTISGNLPTTKRLQVNIFNQNTSIAGHTTGYYASASGIFTIPIAVDAIATTSDYFNMRILVDGTSQPTVLSGIDQTFLCSHMIRAVVADVEDTPVAVSAYCNNYDNDIPDSTWTEIDYDSERYDTDSMFTAATSHHKININTAGKYAITASSDTHRSDGVTYLIGQRIVHSGSSGTTVIATAYNESLDRGSDCCDGRQLLTMTDYELEKDDVITVEIYQESGSTHNDFLRPGDGNIYVTLHRIGS